VLFELIAQAAAPAVHAAAGAAHAAAPAAHAAATKTSPEALKLMQQQIQAQLAGQSLQYQVRTPLQQHAPWLTHTFAGIFIVAALAFIALLAVQTTKQEGLSGTIGGRVDSNYRGRIGFEGQIARVTQTVAITFVVIATIVSLSGI
jgi:preprotein translocase subunit SecG